MPCHPGFAVRAFVGLVLIALAPASWGQAPRITYSTLLEASRPKALTNAADGDIWTVANASHPLACAGASECSRLVRIDPEGDRVALRVLVPGVHIQAMQVLAGDRLLIYGPARSADALGLPHDPALVWARPSASSSAGWLGVVNAAGVIEQGAFLQDRIGISALHGVADDVLLVGQHGLATCPPGQQRCLRTRLARVSADLRQMRFDVQPTPDHDNYPSASAVAADGRIYVATAGSLPSLATSAFPTAPAEQPGVISTTAYYLSGGLIAVTASGALRNASYTRTHPATQLVYDARRRAVWLQARSTQGNLVATADAMDRTCGEDGRCNARPTLCEAVGYCMGPGDTVLARLNEELDTLQYASYLSGNHAIPQLRYGSEWPRALLLNPRGDLYVASGNVSTGSYYNGGVLNWLLWPAQGPILQIGRLPAAPIDAPQLTSAYWGTPGPILTTRGDEIWTAVGQTAYDATLPTLVGSAGLDAACGSEHPCLQLTRTLLPRGALVQTIATLSPGGLAVLLGGLLLVTALLVHGPTRLEQR